MKIFSFRAITLTVDKKFVLMKEISVLFMNSVVLMKYSEGCLTR